MLYKIKINNIKNDYICQNRIKLNSLIKLEIYFNKLKQFLLEIVYYYFCFEKSINK